MPDQPVRYWVRVSTAVYALRDTWPTLDGWRVTGAEQHRGSFHHVEIEDDEADPAIAGRLVDVDLHATPEGVRIVGRRPLP